MPEQQTKITPTPALEYHSVCPIKTCGGPLSLARSRGSICMKCAAIGNGMIYAALDPADARLSARMIANADYPLAAMTGLKLTKGSAKELDCLTADVWAIDGQPGLYVRAKASDKDTRDTVQARSEGYRLWVFWRWGESKVLLDAVERVLSGCPAADVAGSVAADTSPDYPGRYEGPIEEPELTDKDPE